RLSQRAERIPQHDPLPAQKWQSLVIALGQGAALEVSGQQVVGSHAGSQKRLIDIPRNSGRSFMQRIRTQALGRSGKVVQLVNPGGEGPIVGRALKGAAIGRNKFGSDCSRKEFETQPPAFSLMVVGAPGGVADYVLLIVEHLRRIVESHAIRGQ